MEFMETPGMFVKDTIPIFPSKQSELEKRLSDIFSIQNCFPEV